MSVSASHGQFAFDFAELNLSRIAAISATACVHILAFMFLMVPVSMPDRVAHEDIRTEIILTDRVIPKPIVIPPKPLVAKPIADKPDTLNSVVVNKPRVDTQSIEVTTSDAQINDVYVPERQIGTTENVETISGGDVDATRAQYPVRYPAGALRAQASGLVIVLARYNADGIVTETRIHKTSRNKDLDRSALQGVKKWKINPRKINGQSIGGEALVEVVFKV
jgi:periplasmic protein TonB